MTRALGIDLSKWEGLVDYAKAFAHGASFVYVKASQLVADPAFAVNWKNAKGIMPRGAYHYLDLRTSELAQAQLFCNLLANDRGELPPCLDFEDDPQGIKYPGLTKAIRTQRAYNFLDYVERTLHVTPMVYTGYYYWGSYGSIDAKYARYPLWLSWYAAETIVRTPKPWTHWTFWQYTDHEDGKAFGCSSLEVDANYFSGTVDELRTFANVVQNYITCPTCHGTGKVLA